MLFDKKQFTDFIKSNSLFAPQDRILLTVSGGKDSVTMAYLFAEAGCKFGIAHCNFNLRGEEAIRDENFVKQLAFQFDVPFHLKSFDTKRYAEQNKISIQMAARDLRYAFFEEVRAQENYSKIAIAQHQNDAIETVLLNLIRGTGIAGLHGIKANRNFIIRPMLCFTAADIEQIVTKNGFNYVEDSSNASNKYMRNKIRLDIIPEMKKLNPSLEQSFLQNLKHFNELEELLNNQVEKLRKDILIQDSTSYQIKIADISNLKPQELLLFELLKPFNFNSTSVQNIIAALEGISGKQFFSESHVLTLDRDFLIIDVLQNPHINTVSIENLDDEVVFRDFRLKSRLLHKQPETLKTNQNLIYVDADLLVFPLKLRSWEEGDNFKPFGLKGFKKLSDFFINQKIALQQKSQIPILINGNNEIIWVCGYRNDDRYKVKPNTKKIIIFELEKL